MSQSFPLPETPHRISIYKKEPRRLGQPIVTPTKTATTKLPQPMISVNGSIDKIQTRIASIDTRTPKRLIQQTHPRSPRIVRHQPKAKKLCLDKIFLNSENYLQSWNRKHNEWIRPVANHRGSKGPKIRTICHKDRSRRSGQTFPSKGSQDGPFGLFWSVTRLKQIFPAL